MILNLWRLLNEGLAMQDSETYWQVLSLFIGAAIALLIIGLLVGVIE